jgi:hypothetical protein
MVLAFVSMTHSITIFPAEFITAIEIDSLLCRARHNKEHADFPIMPNLDKPLSQLPVWQGIPRSSYELHSA